MTLDEAIIHAREVAEEQLRRSGKCTVDDDMCDKFSSCLKCAEEHEQLAEWLEELKAIKENNHDFFTQYKNDAYNKGYEDGRKDAIEEFVEFTKNDWRIEQACAIADEPTEIFRIGGFCARLLDELKNGFMEQLKEMQK